MTQGTKIAWDDTVLPFQLDNVDMRGRVARLDGVLEGILKQHDYPPQVEALVAEMALLTALIGQTIKLRWKLSLQVQSKGAVRMIATDYVRIGMYQYQKTDKELSKAMFTGSLQIGTPNLQILLSMK